MASLFLGLFNGRKLIVPVLAIGLLGTLILGFYEQQHRPDWYKVYENMISFDGYAAAFSGVMILTTIIIFFMGGHFFRKDIHNLPDIFGLMMFTLAGGVILTSFNNLSMLFLGIEILSIPLYILAGSRRFDLTSNEASIKYFLMGSFSTGFLLFGIALIYGQTHSFSMEDIRIYLGALAPGSGFPPMFSIGVLMMLVSLLFKISAVPFHFWAPDVYQGSPTLITTFMATVVKTAGFAALFRLLSVWFGGYLPEGIANTLWVVTGLTITVANLSALWQGRMKRMLAYSSISNAGYMLIAVTAMNNFSSSSIFYYALVYSIGTAVCFGVLIAVLESRGNDDYTSFHGMAWKNPLLTFCMTLGLLSLAGIPPLAGFFGKYYIFRTALESNHVWIVMLALINSLIGIYYYFRIIVSMFARESIAREDITVDLGYKSVLIVSTILLLVLGLFPDLVTGLIGV